MSRRFAHAIALRLIDAASAIVPAPRRDRFREEWRAELWHARDTYGRWRLVRTSIGAFADARLSRRLHPGNPRRNRMLRRDLALALRGFAKQPLLALVAVFTLAVAIGANTSIFSLVNAVLLRPLDYPEPESLVKIRGRDLETGVLRNLSPADFYDLAAASRTMESMGAHGWVGFFTVTGELEPERVGGTTVTAGFFETLGVKPVIGRLFTEEDDQKDAPPTVVLTHAFWQRQFGGRFDVVGESLTVNAVSHEIVGVLPQGYTHPEPNPEREPALYTLYQFDRSDLSRDGRFVRAVGRLGEGRSLDEARAELESIAARLEETYPESNIHRGVHLESLKESIVSDARAGLLVLFGAVGAVLLIACVNLANLQLAHGAKRRHALAIHAALGASRFRLVRALVIESILLAFAGAALGLLLAYGTRGLITGRSIPRAGELSFDTWVFVFTFLVASLTSLVFGLVPALSLSNQNLGGLVAERATRGASARRGSRRVLIAAEIAISVVLLVGAGLFVKSLTQLRSVAPGFRADRVLTMSVSLPLARYEEGEQIPFYEELYERLRSLPGLTSVGAINILPLTNNYSQDGFQIDDRPVPRGENPSAEARSVSAGYFDALGVPLLRGRLFDERDRVESPGVVIISEAMAERFWPNEDPVGKRITYNRGIPDELSLEVGGAGSREIVGIVGNVKHLGLDEGVIPMFYTPQPHQPSFHTMTLVLRTSLEAETVAGAVRAELARMDDQIPLYSIRPLDDVLDAAVASPRFRTIVVGLFAAVALGLALVGVYSVMRLVVSQREQEIGIRMALGARAGDVIGMLVGETMRPVVLGLLLGVIGALALGRFVASLLFGTTPSDPAVYVSVAVALALAALIATLAPSLRAARIDPIQTLRPE
ncbi:MAG TPA: ABC transporter permease [Vicinamibacteria bacterium]|nr:ABC transporter permease [Vicinamibacteria bacterium]